MKLLIIILLVTTVVWAWRSGSPATKESEAAVIEATQQQAAAPNFQGRWRNDKGQIFAFRENGSFQMSRRLEENHEGVKLSFSAGMRGKWRQENEEMLTLTVEKVESVTVHSATPDRSLFKNNSAADTLANKLRKDLPQQFTQLTEGTARSLGLKWQSRNQLVLEDAGDSIILTRVE